MNKYKEQQRQGEAHKNTMVLACTDEKTQSTYIKYDGSGFTTYKGKTNENVYECNKK